MIILLWAFYSSQILLFGAEFTAVYASECGSRLVPADDAVAVGEPAKSNEAEQQAGKRRGDRLFGEAGVNSAPRFVKPSLIAAAIQ